MRPPLLFVLSLIAFTANLRAADSPPNVILILADDLGYSDISPFGGEIRTPNLQSLADHGLRFRNFYNSARCCPTRASLLTGLAPHQAGVGHMAKGASPKEIAIHPPYQGFLNQNCVTLAEALRLAGYRTLMAGKWHVGPDPGMRPRDRGFDRFYGIIAGASNYYQPGADKLLMLDDTPVKLPVPDNFYLTDAITDHAIDFLAESVERHHDQPFFLYLAYTSPHFPLQAPEKCIAPYRELYARGWDVLRPERMAGVIKAGVVPEGTLASPGVAPRWDSLPPAKQREMTERMAIYAGMVESMDTNIGRVLATLKRLGVADDTIIFFLSDNGGNAEGGMLGSNNGELLGTKKGYFLTLGEAWANYCNTPFRQFKHYTGEGGIRTPFIVNWPKGITKAGGWSNQVGTIADFMPTLLELAGGTYPETNGKNKTLPLTGISLASAFRGEPAKPRQAFFEHEGNKAAINGDWKLTQKLDEPWRLTNLQADPVELDDRSKAEPDRAETMRKAWEAWAKSVGVLQPWPKKKPEDKKSGSSSSGG